MNSKIWEKIIIAIGLIGFGVLYFLYIIFGMKGLQYSFEISDGWAAFIAFILSYSKLNIILIIFVLIGLYQYLK